MRLAYLSPDVLERLLLLREGPSATLLQMIEATYGPWAEQMGVVFDCPGDKTGNIETRCLCRPLDPRLISSEII